jgi:hypothetical protein
MNQVAIGQAGVVGARVTKYFESEPESIENKSVSFHENGMS